MHEHYTRTSSRMPAPGYQPPARHAAPSSVSPGPFDQLQDRFTAATSTLDAIIPMIDVLKQNASSEFERGVVNCMSLLTAQVRELKLDQMKLRDEVVFQDRAQRKVVDHVFLTAVKTEQYSRRDTVTVVGVAMPESESQDDLSGKVASAFSSCGEVVTPADLSAVHRNFNRNRTDNKSGKTIPPSITVRFCRINKKDNIMKRYRNFDHENKRPREVKVYQSLSKHYSDVRTSIVDFFQTESCDVVAKYGLDNCGGKLKWCTYQSPTSGFAVKLDVNGKDVYFNGVHIWADFVGLFNSKCKT